MDLCATTLLHGDVTHEEEEEPHEGGAGRLGTGEEQIHDRLEDHFVWNENINKECKGINNFKLACLSTVKSSVKKF